jgi:hypothetical protein
VQHIFDDLTHHAQWLVTGDASRVLPAFVVKTAPPHSPARLDHIEYGNVPRVAGERISASNPVVRQQQARCGKPLEDLGEGFVGKSIEIGQVMGAERTLDTVLRQVLCSDETVTCFPGQQPSKPR